MTRVRRCSWGRGARCHEPATYRVQATYLGVATDSPTLFCTAHAERVDELIVGYQGWAIASIEPYVAPAEEVTA